MRRFELPYNFDKNLILGYQLLGLDPEQIDCIYIPPFLEDYQTILRTPEKDAYSQLTYEEYLDHINYINNIFPGKMQLLLQQIREEYNMSNDLLKKYINLGFRNFCVGNIQQAKAIKEIDPHIKVVGSIAMHVNAKKIMQHFEEYSQYFDALVLDFSYNKNLSKIKSLPKNFEYMILANSRCNIHCDGDRHWWGDGMNHKCPGLYPDIPYHESCMIRPTDLHVYEPYIKVFKLQDRGWPTADILHSVAMYCCDIDFYLGPMIADASIYQN